MCLKSAFFLITGNCTVCANLPVRLFHYGGTEVNIPQFLKFSRGSFGIFLLEKSLRLRLYMTVESHGQQQQI